MHTLNGSVAVNVVRVLLVERLGLIRQGIRSVLTSAQDLEIVGEADNTDDAVRLSVELKPDVVLVAEDIDNGDGPHVVGAIKQRIAQAEIIIMTDRVDEAKAVMAIEAGARGYILKDIPGANLAGAVRSVSNGQGFLHPEITRKVMDRLGRLVKEQRRHRSETGGLTERELEILIEIAKGCTDQEIATRFVITEGTVKTHVRHILRKLRVRNRAQAVADVLRKGFIK
jgi:NarL family two-component system response regulator LiaR